MLFINLFTFVSAFSFLSAHSVLQKPGNRVGLTWHSWHPSDGTGFSSGVGNVLATYSRNQIVPVSWARNNHQGGFVRFSITTQESISHF